MTRQLPRRKAIVFAYDMREFLSALKEGRQPQKKPVTVIITLKDGGEDFIVNAVLEGAKKREG